MPETLDIIIINIWSILISLANLIILFFILKKFLYKPLKKVLEQRRQAVDSQYEAADEAKISAEADKKAWEGKLSKAQEEADGIIKSAEKQAEGISNAIISKANEKAEGIIRHAENEADLERKKAETEIKTQIADLSAILAEKMLEREINNEDHRDLIDSFINEVGDNNGGNA